MAVPYGHSLVAEGPERPAEAAVGAVGHHDVAGPELDRRGGVRRLHDRAPHEPPLDRPARPRRCPAAGWPRRPRRSGPPSSRGPGGARRSRRTGRPGARATAAPASVPCAVQRSPSKRWNCSAPRPDPCRGAACTARGVSPSPQVFSRGKVLRSTTATSWPWRASQYAAAAPAGPPPMTSTSKDRALGTDSVRPRSRADALFVQGRLAAVDGFVLRRSPVRTSRRTPGRTSGRAGRRR